MEPWTQLRRRSTDLFAHVHQSLPSMPRLGRSAAQGQLAGTAIGATWQRVDGLPPLPRSSHSLDVVAGAAYIFGGELGPGEPADNQMLVVRLPYSSAGADYYKVEAVAAKFDERPEAETRHDTDEQLEEMAAQRDLQDVPLEEMPPASKGKEPAAVEGQHQPSASDVPAPRVGHATAVIGSRIFLFGGRGGPDMAPLDEAGRVWVFDTRSRTWTYLDPVPAVTDDADVPHPAARSQHCAAATEHPRDLGRPSAPRKPQTWRQWAVGDSSRTGIPQDPVVGRVAEEAVDQESDGYGTFLVHAGRLADGERTADLWSFDVASRTWTELPAAPGPARDGSAICISKSRLFRFGGFDGANHLGGQLDFLPLKLQTFDDGAAKAEVSIAARSGAGWQTILADNPDASSTDIPAEASQPWPAPRSAASLHVVSIGGGGREYLVLAMGEASADASFLDDIWTFQVPPLGMTSASLTDAVLQAVGRKTGEGRWSRVAARPFDDDDDDDDNGQGKPAPRGWLASAPMGDVEEGGIVFWGGSGQDSQPMGDGWILRLGD